MNLRRKLACAFIIASGLLTAGCSLFRKDSSGPVSKKELKVGFVYVGSIRDNGYTQSLDTGRIALEKEGIKTVFIENVPDSNLCILAIEELINQGCQLIYTTSYGHLKFTKFEAVKHPEIRFGHCSGGEVLPNMNSFFGRMYEARYLSGIVAGLKTTSNKIGYVAGVPIPEVIRGLNAFAQGVQAVNPDATIEVIWTNSWLNEDAERNAATKLFNSGCDVFAQHVDTNITQKVAQQYGAYCIGYNYGTRRIAPKAYLTAPVFYWKNFFVEDVRRFLEDRWEPLIYWGGLESGMVGLDDLSPLCNPGSVKKVEEMKSKIIEDPGLIFRGPVYDNKGTLRVDVDETLTDEEIWNMDWYVQGINVIQM